MCLKSIGTDLVVPDGGRGNSQTLAHFIFSLRGLYLASAGAGF